MCTMPTPPSYDERLVVPVRWWLLATLFVATLLVAFLVSTPAWVALGCTAVLVVLVVAVFVGYGRARVRVADGVLEAGQARIPVRHLGAVQALDAEATRAQAGRDADARAYLLIRPYLRQAVRIDIEDPADPTPYWLVGTRHAERLTAALTPARSSSGGITPSRDG
jgi:Protein of unknown function (DUF3093)